MTGEASVKRMMEWVEGLKRQSDYGQHMNIPSGLSARTCWELANELEQFLKALEAKGEPVAWLDSDGFPWSKEGVECRTTKDTYTPLYTTPPQRTLVGLTDEEIEQGLLRSDYALQTAHAWRAGVVFAMTQLKERNT